MNKLALSFFAIFSIAACTSPESKPAGTDSAATGAVISKDSVAPLVPGPLSNSVMTKEYVYQMGRQIYFWAWPLVNMHNRLEAFRKVPEPGLNGGAVPAAPPGRLCMMHDYITPDERYVACPNQDVFYGASFLDLKQGPTVLQIPDFGDRFWVCQMGNQRTDGIGKLGAMYGSKKGFYLIVGPDWKGDIPKGITETFRSGTNIAYAFPRVFVNSDAQDKASIQSVINQIMAYPLSEFDGTWKTKDWTKIPIFPDPLKASGGKEVAFVMPEIFFDELPAVMEECPPQRGEEAMYTRYKYVLDAAAKDPELKAALKKAAVDAEKELIDPLRQFKNVGVPVGNYWNTTKNGAAFGTDYLTRTGAARSNIFVNQPNEAIYYNQDRDGAGKDLDGKLNYSITFTKAELPAVKGFWSLTVYDVNHFFYQNPDKIYSLGTKNRDLVYNADGSLTLYLQNRKPGGDKGKNWLPTPPAKFGLLLRAYWPEDTMLQAYTPPPLLKSK